MSDVVMHPGGMLTRWCRGMTRERYMYTVCSYNIRFFLDPPVLVGFSKLNNIDFDQNHIFDQNISKFMKIHYDNLLLILVSFQK